MLLEPARHIEAPVRDVSSEYAQLRTQLAKAVTGLDVEMPHFALATAPAGLPITTIVDLVRTVEVPAAGCGEGRPGR